MTKYWLPSRPLFRDLVSTKAEVGMGEIDERVLLSIARE